MIRILCDFDGVLTNQIDEAKQVKDYFYQEITRIAGIPSSEARAVLDAAEHTVMSQPHEFGWFFNDRIAAFADEDFFIRNNAIAFLLDDIVGGRRNASLGIHDQKVETIAEKLAKSGVENFITLAGWAFRKMTEQTQKSGHKPLDPAAAQTLKQILEKNIQFTIVSNSGTERIQDILTAANLDQAIEVKGGARKFELGTKNESLRVGSYTVATDRPVFEDIIMELEPDIFIGDVFSLDLALPLHLIESGKIKSRRGLCLLRTQSYTPTWSLDFCKKYSGSKAQIGLLPRFEDLLTWIGTA